MALPQPARPAPLMYRTRTVRVPRTGIGQTRVRKLLPLTHSARPGQPLADFRFENDTRLLLLHPTPSTRTPSTSSA